jgi:hypothetical protein
VIASEGGGLNFNRGGRTTVSDSGSTARRRPAFFDRFDRRLDGGIAVYYRPLKMTSLAPRKILSASLPCDIACGTIEIMDGKSRVEGSSMSKRSQAPPGSSTRQPRGTRAPKAKPNKRIKDRTKEAITLIPLTYNDGSEIPVEKLSDIRDQIFLAFEGWTQEGIVEGAYSMASGEKRVEQSLKLSIILKESDVPTLSKMASEWASELGQEAILIKITDYEVIFAPPQREGNGHEKCEQGSEAGSS